MFILMSTWTVLKDLAKKDCLIKNIFYSSVKDGTTGDNGEKRDSHSVARVWIHSEPRT